MLTVDPGKAGATHVHSFTPSFIHSRDRHFLSLNPAPTPCWALETKDSKRHSPGPRRYLGRGHQTQHEVHITRPLDGSWNRVCLWGKIPPGCPLTPATRLHRRAVLSPQTHGCTDAEPPARGGPQTFPRASGGARQQTPFLQPQWQQSHHSKHKAGEGLASGLVRVRPRTTGA